MTISFSFLVCLLLHLGLYQISTSSDCAIHLCNCSALHPFTPTKCNYLLPEYTVTGNHHQIGYSIGSLLKTSIRNYLFSESVWCNPTYENLGYVNESADPHSHYARNLKKMKDLAREKYPQYVEELLGIANGAGIDENFIWSINFQDELFITELLLSINSSTHKRKPKHEKPEGCTNLFYIDKENGKVYFGHNEDGDAAMDNGMVLLHVKVADTARNEHYNYTVGYYLGMLPGWSFGFNSYGLVLDMNSLYPLNMVPGGLGTAWISRDLFSARSISEAIEKCTNSQIALGGSFNIGSLKEKIWLNVEVLPGGVHKITNHTDIASKLSSLSPSKNYFFYHMNVYEYAQSNGIYPWFYEAKSSSHRRITIANWSNRNGRVPSNMTDMAAVIGTTEDAATIIDGIERRIWRRDLNYDTSFTLASVIGEYDIATSELKYRVWGTGINPNDCRESFIEFDL